MKFVNILIAFLLISCTLEPKYKTPIPSVELIEEDAEKITWQEFFVNPELQNLISYALSNNINLSITYLNIKIAKQNYRLQEAKLLPNINASSGGVFSSSDIAGLRSKESYSLNANLSSFEIDLFGKIRSSTKAAQQNILATVEDANTVRISLISQVANSYISYITLRQNIDILTQNINLYTQKYNILKSQEKAGVINKDVVYQAEITLEGYKSLLNASKRALKEEKTNLDLLVGGDTRLAIATSTSVSSIKLDTSKLKETPSSILLQRPDIKKAEYSLKAENANIGNARAMFFPAINLTGMFGFSSAALSSLFSNNGGQFSPLVSLPIFDGGTNSANLKKAKIQKKRAVLQYQNSIQVAFKEALDSLSKKDFISLELDKTKLNLANQVKILGIKNSQFKAGSLSKAMLIEQQILVNTAQIENNKNIQDNLTATVVVYKTLGQGL